MKIPVILIFDIGKTNKKLLLFDEQYNLVLEDSATLEETADEDGFACENIVVLNEWVRQKFGEITANSLYKVGAVNFSAYGASFVNLGDDLQPVTPLYNYLKPYPEHLKKQFYDTYGGESSIAKDTASPLLGNLNSGMQLYRLKYERPEVFEKIKYSLHLPQYLSFILTGQVYSDITSIGCHTQLWDFQGQAYHEWVSAEGINKLLAPIFPGDKTVMVKGGNIVSGIGLHDSSAALVPYLASVEEPFILLSTGTWCISLNPFNHSVLSDYELHQDCLCYLTYMSNPVKASRLFAGYEHEQQVKRLATHFDKPLGYYKTVGYDETLLRGLPELNGMEQLNTNTAMVHQSAFGKKDLSAFTTYEEAYHQLIYDIMVQQVRSIKLVLTGTAVTQIFVDGGFGSNQVYMNMLAFALPHIKVYAATVGQASALGAALAIHKSWNGRQEPENMIQLKRYVAKGVV
jgi:sugar (pentulose or hexulose) kinase